MDVICIVVNTTHNDLTAKVFFDMLKKLSKNVNCDGDLRGRGELGPDPL
jgi:hypothetical protein